METGPVTRSRRNVLNADSIEKETTDSNSPTNLLKDSSDKLDTELTKMNTEEAIASPLKVMRSRRSMSLTTNPPDSPSRNLRKRAVTPDLSKNTPKKIPMEKLDELNFSKNVEMTPNKRLLKQFEGSLVTIDSPKPRKGRLSLENPEVKPENVGLRRSRRLSTELNVVEEDPEMEAVTESITTEPIKSLPKMRRGKRLSVVPSQPAVPEEIEINIDEKEDIAENDEVTEYEENKVVGDTDHEIREVSIVIKESCSGDEEMKEDSSTKITDAIFSKKFISEETTHSTETREASFEIDHKIDNIDDNLIESSEKSINDLPDKSPKDISKTRNSLSPSIEKENDVNKSASLCLHSISNETSENFHTSPEKSLKNLSLNESTGSKANSSKSSIVTRSSQRILNKSMENTENVNKTNESIEIKTSSLKTPNNSMSESVNDSTPKNKSGRNGSRRLSSSSGEMEVLKNSPKSLIDKSSDSPLKVMTVESEDKTENMEISDNNDSLDNCEKEIDPNDKTNISQKLQTSICDNVSSPNSSSKRSLRISAAEVFLKENKTNMHDNSSTNEKVEKFDVDKSFNDSLVSKNIKEINKATSTPLSTIKSKNSGSHSNNKVISPSSNSKNIINSDTSESNDTEDDDEEDENDEEEKLFLDEAEDAGSDYQSGDSMDESEKREIEDNEIIEKGETLHSDSSVINSDDTYEKDSFICSDDEEDNQLLSGTGDDLSSGEELSQSAKSKKKFNEKAKKIQKKASREMYEARHDIKNGSKSRDNSGKNNFLKSSSVDESSNDENDEKEISNIENSNYNNISKDPLCTTITVDTKESSKSEIHESINISDEDSGNFNQMYDEELKKLLKIEMFSDSSNDKISTDFDHKNISNERKSSHQNDNVTEKVDKNNSISSSSGKSIKNANNNSLNNIKDDVNNEKPKGSPRNKLDSVKSVVSENETNLMLAEKELSPLLMSSNDKITEKKNNDEAKNKEKSNVTKHRNPSKHNLSDIVQKKKNEKQCNKSLDFDQNHKYNNSTIKECMQRLNRMSESISNVYSYVQNSVDQVKYSLQTNVFNKLPSIRSNESDNDENENSLPKENSLKRKHEQDKDESKDNPKKTCLPQDTLIINKTAAIHQTKLKKQKRESSDLKRISQKSKTIKKSRDSDSGIKVKTIPNITGKFKNISSDCVVSTTDFNVEDIGVHKGWTASAGTFIVTGKEKKISTESTTTFKVVSLKKRPKQEVQVADFYNLDLMNFKNQALYKNNKREQSTNLKKYQHKRIHQKTKF